MREVARWSVALVAAGLVAVTFGVVAWWWLTHVRHWQSSGDVIALVSIMVAAVVGLGAVVAQSWATRTLPAEPFLRIPIAAVARADPTAIGVDPAAQTVLAGGRRPDYLPRMIDAGLRAALVAAMDGLGPWLVVVTGRSKVGKSRTLFEALEAVGDNTAGRHRPLRLVAPVDVETLRALLAVGRVRRDRSPAVLWLDDLEPFLNQGLGFPLLSRWQSAGPRRIVVATYGGKGSDLVAGSSTLGLATLASGVLQHAREIRLESTTTDELVGLPAGLPDAEVAAIGRHGLAAYLVAGPELTRKMDLGRCPEGLAVVRSAVDWARCGRTDAITEDTLRRLWPSYLDGGLRPTDHGFALGLDWAQEPVAGSIRLLQWEAGGYAAYDYVVRLTKERPDAQAPVDSVWAEALQSAHDAQAEAVGFAAYEWSRLADAADTFDRARQSADRAVSAYAGSNLGVIYGKLNRPDEALAAFQRVVDDYGSDPALGEQVANALYNQGVELGARGREDEALAAYQRVIDDYGSDPAPAVRGQAAIALLNQGVILGARGRSDEEFAVYQRVIDDYGTDPALREQVAKALVNQGVRLRARGRADEALAAYQRVIDDYGSDPALREQVALALLNQGVALGARGRSDEEFAVYQRVIDDYSSDPAPILRKQVAIALVNQGAALGIRGRADEARAAFQRVVDDYGSDPALGEQVAIALRSQGVVLGARGRSDEELAAYQRVIDDYSSDPHPALREQVAKALVNQAAALGARGRSDEELAAYQRVIDDYSSDRHPALREVVAKALANQGAELRERGRPDDARAAFQRVVDNYSSDPHPALRGVVAHVMRAIHDQDAPNDF